MSGEADPQRRLKRILASQDLLAEVSASLGPDLALEDVLNTVLKAMRRLVDFRGGTIQLIDERGVYIAAADPPVDPAVAEIRIRIGEGISGRVVATGTSLRSDDIENDTRVSPAFRAVGGNRFIHSYVAVPLVCLGEVIGALQMDSSEVAAFDDDDVTLLGGLAAQVAGVIESARRYELITELERLKGDFLTRVSHELRTPITIIDGLVRTLLVRDDLSFEQQREMLDRCRTASARLGGLVEDLLTLTRLEGGVLVATPMRAPLKAVLAGVAQSSLRPEDVAIDCPVDAEALVDAEILRRALSCLVDNALKYAGRAQLVVREHGTIIEVIDEGPGLSDDVRAAAFELFTRSMSTLSVPGLGLGLPLARTLLDATGASLSIDSTAGVGTVARVQLPG